MTRPRAGRGERATALALDLGRRLPHDWESMIAEALRAEFLAGAEAMREKAAKVAEEYPSTRTECEDGVCGNNIADVIRAIPLDKLVPPAEGGKVG